MPCEECRELHTHRFGGPADLVNALQVAAAEVDRGVLEPVAVPERSLPEQEAVDSALRARAFPDAVLYRFKCTICGDNFELSADTNDGSGEWRRNEERNAS